MHAKAVVVFFRSQRFPAALGFQEAVRIHVSNPSLSLHPHPLPMNLQSSPTKVVCFPAGPRRVRNREQADLAAHLVITLQLTNTPGKLAPSQVTDRDSFFMKRLISILGLATTESIFELSICPTAYSCTVQHCLELDVMLIWNRTESLFQVIFLKLVVFLSSSQSIL